MKGKKLYIKLFFVKVIIKNKNLKPASKKLSSFLDFYGSEMRWKYSKRFFIFKSAGHFGVRCFLNGLYLQLLCTSIVKVKNKNKIKNCCLW